MGSDCLQQRDVADRIRQKNQKKSQRCCCCRYCCCCLTKRNFRNDQFSPRMSHIKKKKLSIEGTEQLAQGHIASQGWKQDQNSGPWALRCALSEQAGQSRQQQRNCPKIQILPIEEPTRGIFSMGSWFKARLLYAHWKAVAPIHLCISSLHAAKAQANAACSACSEHCLVFLCFSYVQ